MFQLVKWINKRCRNAIDNNASVVHPWSVKPAAMAGVRGCQRRGDAVPRVGSTLGNSCPKLSWGNPTWVYANDNPSCVASHGSSLLNALGLRVRRRYGGDAPDARVRQRWSGWSHASVPWPRARPCVGRLHTRRGDRPPSHDPVRASSPLGPRAPLGGAGAVDGGRAPRATPWRLVPCARHMQQGRAVCRQVSAGTNGDQVRGDRRDPFQPQSGFSWRARADDKGYDPAPRWGKSHPDPGIARGVTGGLRPGERRVWRMDNAPPVVPRARADGQLWPRLPRDPPTRRGGAIEPGPPVS